jgi:hypothetical protein
MNKKNLLFIAAVVVTSLAIRARAQEAASQLPKQNAMPMRSANSDTYQAPSDDDIQLLRKDLRSQKKQIVAANMNLTDAEAEKFWPVYDQYTADLAKITDKKAALINDYFQTYSTMTGEQAESYIRSRGAVEEAITQLRLHYVPIFRKVLSGRQTALFFQIEWRLGLMIDLQLAQMPLIDP